MFAEHCSLPRAVTELRALLGEVNGQLKGLDDRTTDQRRSLTRQGEAVEHTIGVVDEEGKGSLQAQRLTF